MFLQGSFDGSWMTPDAKVHIEECDYGNCLGICLELSGARGHAIIDRDSARALAAAILRRWPEAGRDGDG